MFDSKYELYLSFFSFLKSRKKWKKSSPKFRVFLRFIFISRAVYLQNTFLHFANNAKMCSLESKEHLPAKTQKCKNGFWSFRVHNKSRNPKYPKTYLTWFSKLTITLDMQNHVFLTLITVLTHKKKLDPLREGIPFYLQIFVFLDSKTRQKSGNNFEFFF